MLDVRTIQEFRTGHIETAQLLPLSEIQRRKGESTLSDVIQVSADDESAEIIVYCKMGGRSEQAARILIEAGYPRVCQLIGGITAWDLEETAPTNNSLYALGNNLDSVDPTN